MINLIFSCNPLSASRGVITWLIVGGDLEEIRGSGAQNIVDGDGNDNNWLAIALNKI